MTVRRFRERRVVLDDGTTVTVRAIRSDDRGALRAAFHKLSPESRFRRFHGHIGDLSEPMLRYLTDVDGDHHFAVVALAPRPPREKLSAGAVARWLSPAGEHVDVELIGVARMIRLTPAHLPSVEGAPLDDGELARTAEVAVTVADAFQERGLGSRLMEILVDRAKRSDIDALLAHVAPENVAMLALLRRAGPTSFAKNGVVTASLRPRDTASKKKEQAPSLRLARSRAVRMGRVNFALAMRWVKHQRRQAS